MIYTREASTDYNIIVESLIDEAQLAQFDDDGHIIGQNTVWS